MIDTDIQFMTRENLKATIVALREQVRYVRDQRLDDLCWMDLYRLYELLPEGLDGLVDLRTDPDMLTHCGVYIDCLRECPLDREEALRVYRQKIPKKIWESENL